MGGKFIFALHVCTKKASYKDRVTMNFFLCILSCSSLLSCFKHPIAGMEEQKDPISNEKLTAERFNWPQSLVKGFIEIYEKHKWKFSSVDFKARRVWETMARELSESGLPECKKVDWKICSNKWKSLTSAYRKMVDHNASTGRDAKHCPFEEELSEVYGYRKNVNPVATCSAGEIPTAGNSSTDRDGSLHSSNSTSPVPRPRKSTMVDESDGELDEELLAAEARKGKRRIRRLIQEEDEYLVRSGICEPAEMEDPTEHVGDHREKEASAPGKRKKENSKGEWSKRSGQILEKLGGRQEERGHSEGESCPAKAR